MPGKRVAGHVPTYRTLGAVTARRPVSEGWSVVCRCGWGHDWAPTKRAIKAAFAAHVASAMPVCRHCGESKPRAQMSKAGPHLCKKCRVAATRAWAEAHPDAWSRHVRRSWLKKKYGITPDDYDRMLLAQGGVCAICNRPPSDPRGYKMHVDHDHVTGRVRGILCGACNKGIGALGDDASRLESAARYLRLAAGEERMA